MLRESGGKGAQGAPSPFSTRSGRGEPAQVAAVARQDRRGGKACRPNPAKACTATERPQQAVTAHASGPGALLPSQGNDHRAILLWGAIAAEAIWLGNDPPGPWRKKWQSETMVAPPSRDKPPWQGGGKECALPKSCRNEKACLN